MMASLYFTHLKKNKIKTTLVCQLFCGHLFIHKILVFAAFQQNINRNIKVMKLDLNTKPLNKTRIRIR